MEKSIPLYEVTRKLYKTMLTYYILCKWFQSIHPVGALMLVNYTLTEEESGRPHGFRLQRGGGTRLQLAADNAEAAARWRAVLAHAIDASNQVREVSTFKWRWQ